MTGGTPPHLPPGLRQAFVINHDKEGSSGTWEAGPITGKESHRGDKSLQQRVLTVCLYTWHLPHMFLSLFGSRPQRVNNNNSEIGPNFPNWQNDICVRMFLGNLGLFWALIFNPGFHYCDLHCTQVMIKNTRTHTEDGHTASKNKTGSGGVQKVRSQGMHDGLMLLFMAAWPRRCLRRE